MTQIDPPPLMRPLPEKSDRNTSRTLLVFALATLSFMPAILLHPVMPWHPAMVQLINQLNVTGPVGWYFFVGPALAVLAAVLLFAFRRRVNGFSKLVTAVVIAVLLWSHIWFLILTAGRR